ncbi:kinesin K39, partial [Trypanosoma grayi]|uniref:kinesin K39 n=1 Tax=Trypanosoma grayi TaxID=71804 RepID=UPI0004F47C14
LLGKATELERQVEESRRQAEYHERANQRLREEHERRERELLEQMRKREAEVESVRRRKDAEVLSGQEQLRKTMADLERERCEREEALRVLSERQEQLNAALHDSQQSEAQRTELQRQNAELAERMHQLESERDTQRRLLCDLERFRDERDDLENAVLLLRTEVEEMDLRHDDTVYHLLSVMSLRDECVDGLVARLGVEHEYQLNQSAHWYADESAAAERRYEAELAERQSALATVTDALGDLRRQLDESAIAQRSLRVSLETAEKQSAALREEQRVMEEMKACVESSLKAVTAERDGLKEELSATKDELTTQLCLLEEAKDRQLVFQSVNLQSNGIMTYLYAGRLLLCGVKMASRFLLRRRNQCSLMQVKACVESSLEAVTAERDGLKEELSSTKDELTGRLRSMEETKACVESSLEAVTAERDGLKEEFSSTKDELTGRLRSIEEAKAGVESSLEAVTAERDGLKEELSATKDELTGRLLSVEEAKAGVESSLEAVTAERD